MRDEEKSRELLLEELAALRRKVVENKVPEDRMEDEKAPRTSEEIYGLIVQNADEGIIVVQDGVIKFLNRKAAEFTGLSEDQLLLHPYLHYIHPDDRENVAQRHEQRVRGEFVPSRYTFRFIGPSGKVGLMEIRAVPVVWEGRPATLDFLTEITEKQKSEETLCQSEERYRTLVENTLEGYFVAEIPSCRILFVNQKYCELMGYSPQQAQQMTLYDLLAPGERSRMEKRIEAHMNRRQVNSLPEKYKVLRKDGAVILVEVAEAAVVFQGVRSIQGIVRDVTQVEQLEKQLQHAQKMQALGILAGGAAHEFNNILTSIQGNTELLAAHLGAESSLERYIREINASCHRAARLTRGLLAFSRVDTGLKVPVKVNQLITNVQQLLRQTLPPNIELQLDLLRGLPFVMAEPSQLEQVFLNLAVNARDAMSEGGTIRFTTRDSGLGKSFHHIYPWAKPGRYMEVVVQDTGNGMPPEVMERIFEPFFTTKQSAERPGLGLSIAYSIVKNHGGYILAESEVDGGTRFHVFLPVQEETLDVDEDSDEQNAPLPKGAEKILVVDDEPQVREITQTMLGGLGYRVTPASHGQEAVDLYVQALDIGEPYALVVLDLVMPVMDGRACIAKILEVNPDARILVVTGYHNEQFITSGLQEKVKGIVLKPFDAASLLRAVRRAIDK